MKHRFLDFGLAAVVVVGAGFAFALLAESQALAQESSVSTPRTPAGKPDFSGMWDAAPALIPGPGQGISVEQRAAGLYFASRRCAPNQKGCREQTNQNNDGEFTGRTDPNRPLYKPEHWDKVQDLDYNTNTMDPMFQCLPDGVPRMGPPPKIVQTATEVIFFYTSARNHDYRIIPTDGRAHDPVLAQDISFYGHAVGHWEGDTLVVDSRGFNDVTWITNRGGYFHSEKMRVIERFRREGNTLHYQVTVEDPEVLLQPWVMNPRVLKLNPDPQTILYEGDLCRDYDPGIIVSKIRH